MGLVAPHSGRIEGLALVSISILRLNHVQIHLTIQTNWPKAQIDSSFINYCLNFLSASDYAQLSLGHRSIVGKVCPPPPVVHYPRDSSVLQSFLGL